MSELLRLPESWAALSVLPCSQLFHFDARRLCSILQVEACTFARPAQQRRVDVGLGGHVCRIRDFFLFSEESGRVGAGFPLVAV